MTETVSSDEEASAPLGLFARADETRYLSTNESFFSSVRLRISVNVKPPTAPSILLTKAVTRSSAAVSRITGEKPIPERLRASRTREETITEVSIIVHPLQPRYQRL